MNNIEKQSDLLDDSVKLRDWVGGLFSGAGGFIQSGLAKADNYRNYGTLVPTPAQIAKKTQQDAANAAKVKNDAALAAAKQKAESNAAATGMGKDFYAAAFGGLGAGLVLTRLQQILSNANKPKLRYSKFSPGPHGVDDDEKIAGDAFDQFAATVTQAPGRLIQALSADKKNQEWRTPVLLTGAGLGLYGGHAIMAQIAERKRKADLEAQIEEAKKQYQKALMNKKVASDLDAAFVVLEKRADPTSDNTPLDTALWLTNKAFDPLRATGLMPYYLAGGVVAPGILSAKMMYDWTRARSKDKALEEARKARARLAGSAPIYIDPEQLAAIKRVAS